MTVPVHFPDGAVRQVPGQLRQLPASSEATGVTFEQVPLNCDPHWRYQRVGKRWVAARRQVVVTALCPPLDEWWRGIAPMTDERAVPSAGADQARADDHGEAMRPAA